MTESWNDVWYESSDGLKLYARDYPNPDSSLTIFCMHGLSRNSADFADLAEVLNEHYRLVVVDNRGRGNSDWDPNPANYQLPTYVNDMFTLIDQLELTNVVLLGTSMGGLMTMLMNAMRPGVSVGNILNDIGPVVDPNGLARIRGYVGKSAPVTNWEDAVNQIKASNAQMFPDLDDAAWLKFTQQLFREDESGMPVLRYDPAIATPIDSDEASAVPPDMWPLFEAMNEVPLLVLRGEFSDILASGCIDEMYKRRPDMEYAEIPRVGHAPLLNEPVSVSAIQNFLQTLVND